MALSGSVKTSTYSGCGLQLSWSATQSVANNQSTLSWTLACFGQASNHYYKAGPITVKINGTTVLNVTDRFEMYGSYSKSGSLKINHNDDGSKSFKVEIDAAIYTFAVNCTADATFTLDKIARTPSAPTSCSISAGYGNFVGLGDTVTIKWSGASGVITGYQIRYKRGNSGWKDWSQGNISSTATSGSKTDSFTATDIDVNGSGNAVQYAVRAMNGSLASAWCYSNTLYIQGGMKIKQSGKWQNGSVWIKVNGTWKRAKRVWIKVNGTWQYDETK